MTNGEKMQELFPEGKNKKNDLGVDVPDNNVGNIDCISRNDVERIIERDYGSCWNENDYYDRLLADLEELPSVTPQEPRWIPVEERLPEEQGLYLVTIKSGDKYYIDTDLYNTLYKKGFRTPNVIAWMPLPQPYKEEAENGDN